ncbi:hypothetical protein SDC9_148065 [bioreactor metagenome]|uniref:Uncharacterized protein n=1 Tax=bioreactor metagenome TaxID=1076179 RepID=A0A645EGI6_9ZZZZ
MRRTAIARALFNRPRLIVADEPTSDLDLQTTLEISAILVGLAKQGTAVIAVTHDPEVAVNATRTLTMIRSRIETDHAENAEASHETE